TSGRGFVVEAGSVIAQTKSGKQVLGVEKGEKALLYMPIGEKDDHVATVGTNRKLLIFPLDQIPVMTRGKGVILQRLKDAKLSDAKSFVWEEGLSWPSGDRTRTESNPMGWLGNRAGQGKMPPSGFPRGNRFG
ncbi:MAG: DNA gyrase C-terminal beta-propeller domain-containing protein, partial [Rhodospirillaceae bacterium]